MLLRSNLTPSEMFKSCFGPENQWAVRQEDDEQGLFHSKPHPSSWPLFYSPRPRNVVHHFQSRCPYGRAFGFQTGFRTQNTWKVGYHRANNWPLYTLKTSPINGVYTSLDNPNEHFFTSVITELWCEYETTQVVKNCRLLLPNACKQTQTNFIQSFGKRSSRQLLQWQQNPSIWPFAVVHTRTSVFKGPFFWNFVSRDCSAIVAENPQQCADSSLGHTRLPQLLFDTGLPRVLICYWINLHV